LDLARSRIRNDRFRGVTEASQLGAAMRGASLLLVFLVAKLAIVWGHSAPLTCLALLAYVWQDAMIALAFAALDISLEKMGATTRIAWAIYWADVQRGKRSEEHTSELQSRGQLVCRLLL